MGRVRAGARRLRDRFASGPVVLLYHRVAELRCDPQLLSVGPSRFEEHVAILRDAFRPMALRAMFNAIAGGELPKGAVAVTFDDGYADNLHAARPVLEKYGVPATVFVAAGYVGGAREFWWDQLERVLLGPSTLPSRIALEIGGRRREWELGEAPPTFDHDRWNVLAPADPSPRHRAYRELAALLRPLPPAERAEVLDRIVEWSGAGEPRPSHLPLTEEELRVLAANELVEIGAHTVTHPVLSALPAESQRWEIEEGRRRLEAILGAQVTSFAYPFGGTADYTPETVRLVQESGFDFAAANVPGIVGRGADPYRLPRILVRDLAGKEFRRRLTAPLA